MPNRTQAYTTRSSLNIFVIQGAYRLAFSNSPDLSDAEGVSSSRSTRWETLEVQTLQELNLTFPVRSHAEYATEPPVERWLQFLQLADQWKRERGATSSITEMVLCPAYQSIIAMGDTVVSFILRRLEEERDDPDQWFWALKVLTQSDPVRDEDRGNYPAMARSWLQWAEENWLEW